MFYGQALCRLLFLKLFGALHSCAMAKGKTVVIRLISNAGTGFFYTYRKNPRNVAKLQLMKHDPIVNKHVLFTETKFKK